MSLYNMINGVNQATFLILPMFDKHPDEYPRFRDCFVGKLKNSDEERDIFGIPEKMCVKVKNKDVISVYMRVGGGNRQDYQKEIDELRNNPLYVEDYDDDFDSTFATFIFEVPKKWKEDFDKIIKGKLKEVSKEYREQMIKVYPKLKKKLTELFKEVAIKKQ